MEKIDFSEERCLYLDYKGFNKKEINKKDFVKYLNKHLNKHGILIHSRIGLILHVISAFLVYKIGSYLLLKFLGI